MRTMRSSLVTLVCLPMLLGCVPAESFPEGCAEKRVDRVSCESRMYPTGTWVIRSQEEYDALDTECEFSTRFRDKPPVPGRGEMLLIVRSGTGGCSQCLMPVCVSAVGDDIVAEFESAQNGGCEPYVVFGFWILVPDSDKPVRVEGNDFPYVDDIEDWPCEDHPLLPDA